MSHPHLFETKAFSKFSCHFVKSINTIRNTYPVLKLYHNYPNSSTTRNLFRPKDTYNVPLNNMVEYTSRPIIVSYMITIGSTTSEELRSQIIAILKMHEKVKVLYITPTNSVKSTWRYNMIKYTSLLMIA